jgi:DNA-directed RNA polymerase subunit RPC12/RpoP
MNYKCENCFHEFTGDDYTLTCPNCGSDAFVKNSGKKNWPQKIILFLRENKLKAAGVLFVLALISWKSCSKEDEMTSTVPKRVVIECDECAVKNTLQLKFSDTLGKPFNLKDFPSLRASLKITYENASLKIGPDGKITLPCIGRGNVLLASEEYALYRTVKDPWPDNIAKIPRSELKKMELPECPKPLSVTGGVISSCTMTVAVSYDKLYPKKEKVQVSIDGKKTWSTKRKWSQVELNEVLAKEEKIDIWYRENKDSKELRPESWSEVNTNLKDGCIIKKRSPEEIVEIKKKITSAFKSFANDPESIPKWKVLVDSLEGVHAAFHINDQGIDKIYTNQDHFLENYKQKFNDIVSRDETPSVKASVLFISEGTASLKIKLN